MVEKRQEFPRMSTDRNESNFIPAMIRGSSSSLCLSAVSWSFDRGIARRASSAGELWGAYRYGTPIELLRWGQSQGLAWMSVGGQFDRGGRRHGGRVATNVPGEQNFLRPGAKARRFESLESHFVQRIGGRAGSAA